MSHSHIFRGRIMHSLITGKAYRSTSKIFSNMDQYTDFLSMNALKGPSRDYGFLLTYAEKNNLLDKVVTAAFAHLITLDYCIITSKAPSSTPITQRQLNADVFMCDNLDQERTRLLTSKKSFLAIKEYLVRHPMECGDNTIHIEWVDSNKETNKFLAFTAQLCEYGISPLQNDASN